MNHLKINICSIQNPLDKRLWSGTPYNICSILISLGLFGTIYDYSIKRFVKILKLLSVIYYNGSKGIERGKIIRYFRGWFLSIKIINSKSDIFLHFGSLGLPFPKGKYIYGKHFLIIDATWKQIISSSNSIDGYSKRLISDSEKLEKRAYEQATHIFTISQNCKKSLIDDYNIESSKISVIKTGRGNIQPYYGFKNYASKKILFIAKDRFIDKGGELLLDAFKIANNIDPDLKLTIVGREDYIKSIITNNNNISILGHVSNEKLQDLFNESSLFVMPAKFEPWGLVYLEALSCKMPIVGLNKNSFPELCNYGEFGYILNEESPQALADLLINAFSNIEELFEKGQKGQAYCIKNYSWELTTNEITKVIKRIARDKNE